MTRGRWGPARPARPARPAQLGNASRASEGLGRGGGETLSSRSLKLETQPLLLRIGHHPHQVQAHRPLWHGEAPKMHTVTQTTFEHRPGPPEDQVRKPCHILHDLELQHDKGERLILSSLPFLFSCLPRPLFFFSFRVYAFPLSISLSHLRIFLTSLSQSATFNLVLADLWKPFYPHPMPNRTP